MADRTNVQSRAVSLGISPEFDGYSKVVINIDDDTQVSAGDDTGRTMEFDNPLGTQQLAETVLRKLRGYHYQPYKAEGAQLDPAAEIGDGLTIKDMYGGIYRRSRIFSTLMKADVSAPHDEEIDHEFKFETPQERKYKREMGDVRASLRIQSDRISAEIEERKADSESFTSQLLLQSKEISAKVSATGGNSSSFSWSLLADRWSVYSGGTEVFRIDKDGGTFSGRVVAASGQIGGFTITASSLYNNLSRFGGTQSRGVYVGTDGIQLGQAFKVTSAGAVTATNIAANNMTLTGTLNIGGTNITAATLRSGAQSAYNNASYWSGGSGYGYSYNSATVNGTSNYPSYFTAGYIYAKTGLNVTGSCNAQKMSAVDGITVGGYYTATWKSMTVKNSAGNNVTIYYLGR